MLLLEKRDKYEVSISVWGPCITDQVALLCMLALNNQSTVLHSRITRLEFPPAHKNSSWTSSNSHLFPDSALFLPVRILAYISLGMETFSKPTGWKCGMKVACAMLERARVCTRLMASLKTFNSHLRSFNLQCHSMGKLAKLIRFPKGVNNCVRVTTKVFQLGGNNGIRVQTIQPSPTRRTAEYLKWKKY